jgi:hypothetical protein
MQAFENKTAQDIWNELDDVLVTEDGSLEFPFYNYDAGTNIMDIWHDIEDHYNVSVGELIATNH